MENGANIDSDGKMIGQKGHEADKLVLPIAIRKKPRSYTRHPIERFVSYQALSLKYCAFVTYLDSVWVPSNIDEAMSVLEWRQAMMEEMEALERMTPGSLVIFLKEEN